MRTTVSIDDNLLRAAKERARERGATLGEVVEAALRRDLAAPESSEPPPHVPVFHGQGGLRPGVRLDSNRELQELLDEGLSPEKLR